MLMTFPSSCHDYSTINIVLSINIISIISVITAQLECRSTHLMLVWNVGKMTLFTF